MAGTSRRQFLEREVGGSTGLKVTLNAAFKDDANVSVTRVPNARWTPPVTATSTTSGPSSTTISPVMTRSI